MLKKILSGILLNGLTLWAVTAVLSDSITYSGGWVFFVVGAFVIGLLNTFVKPILKLVTLPLHFLTLGLSLMLLNGVIFWLFQETLGLLELESVILNVKGIFTYFLAGILFGIINWLLHIIIK